jgi:hypothetical protein
MDCASNHRGISLGLSATLPHPRPGSRLWLCRDATATTRNGYSGQTHRTSLALAERVCRKTDWVCSPRMSGPRHCFRRSPSAPSTALLRQLLQRHTNASISPQRCAGASPGSARRHPEITSDTRRASSPIRPNLSFRYTQGRANRARAAHPTRLARLRACPHCL